MVDYRFNILHVQEQIRKACDCAGRSVDEITLVAVSKTHPVEEVNAACETGLITHLGENRVQEGQAKIPAFSSPHPVTWHLIGQLQRNKARRAVELFSVIQSVDSSRLAAKLETVAAELGVRRSVYLEVNTSGEESKSGVTPDEACEVAEQLVGCTRLSFDGLMTVGPLTGDSSRRRKAFAALRELAEDLRRRTGLPLSVLSMGMSGDFTEAILEGSTMIRVGTAIFGPRDYA